MLEVRTCEHVPTISLRHRSLSAPRPAWTPVSGVHKWLGHGLFISFSLCRWAYEKKKGLLTCPNWSIFFQRRFFKSSFFLLFFCPPSIETSIFDQIFCQKIVFLFREGNFLGLGEIFFARTSPFNLVKEESFDGWLFFFEGIIFIYVYYFYLWIFIFYF